MTDNCTFEQSLSNNGTHATHKPHVLTDETFTAKSTLHAFNWQIHLV